MVFLIFVYSIFISGAQQHLHFNSSYFWIVILIILRCSWIAFSSSILKHVMHTFIEKNMKILCTLCILFGWKIKDDNLFSPFNRAWKSKRDSKTSLIAVTWRYKPPALQRIYSEPDGLMNMPSKILRMFVLKINCFLSHWQSKHTIYKNVTALFFLYPAYF